MHVIFGATGALGSRVATQLLKAGEPVRVVSRDRRRLGDLIRAGAQGATADLLEPDTLAAPLAGAGTLIVAAHGLVPPSRRNHPGAVDGRGVRALVDQAAGAGVGRIVYLSVAGAGEGATAFARVKAAGERHLAGCGVPHTILRASIFMENHALLLMGEPLREGGPVDFFGPGTRPLNWVSVQDVARWVTEAALHPDRPSETLEVGGPEVMTRRQALEVLEEALGTTARRRHLPLPMVRGLRWTVGALHPGLRHLLDLVLAEADGRTGTPRPAGSLDRVGEVQLAQVVAAWVEGQVLEPPRTWPDVQAPDRPRS